MIMQFNNIGIQKTTDMKSPLLSKYCCLENKVQFLAATSFMLSEKYTSNTALETNYNIKKYIVNS